MSRITNLTLPTPHITLGHTAGAERLNFEECKNELILIQRFHMTDPAKKFADIGMKYVLSIQLDSWFLHEF